jgi:hypothetical protein
MWAPHPVSAGYQRLLRCWPPCERFPPPPRSSFGRASLTVSARPSNSRPLRSAMARWPSASFCISTNPKPLGCPVSRSVTILTRSTAPCASNRDRTPSSVELKLRLPTKIFFIKSSFWNLQSSRYGQDRRAEPDYAMLPKNSGLSNYTYLDAAECCGDSINMREAIRRMPELSRAGRPIFF